MGKGQQGCGSWSQLFQGQQLCPLPSLWNRINPPFPAESRKCSESVWSAPAETRLNNAQITALVVGRGAGWGISLELCSNPTFVPEVLFQRHRSSSPSWTIPCVCNCLVQSAGQRITHPGKEDFPGFPQRERSSCSTGEHEQGVTAFISHRWREKRCQGDIWEEGNTELEPVQVKQAESTEPRALELRGSTRLRLGKPQGRKGTLNKDFFLCYSPF